jgi:hypothetical protein
MGVDLGSIIKRLLILSPLCNLSEDDKMIVAGQIGMAMNEAISRAQGPMSADEIRHALANPDAVMVSNMGRTLRPHFDPEPVPLGDIIHARARPCFTCGEMIDEATLINGQMVTLDRDRVRHKLRCKKP